MPAQNGYGYASYYQPPRQKPLTGGLATAASGTATPTNPFGLSAANSMRDAQGGYSPAAPVATPAAKVAQRTPQVAAPTNVQAQQAAAPSTAPTPGGYDINTDPALQQVTAFTGQSDEQANASALKQRQQQVLAYGDQGLAAAVLGAGDPTVAAAAGNPNSTVSQIDTQYQRNLHALDEQLNQANLGYSGYRVTQEGQAAQDKQSQLANAAAGVQGNLDTISGNLSAELGANQQQRLTAANDAANRLAQAAAAASAAAPRNDSGYPANTSYTGLGVAPGAITSDEVAPPILPGPGPGPGTLPPLAAAASPNYPILDIPETIVPPTSAPISLASGAFTGGGGASAPTLDFAALNRKKPQVSYASRALI